MRTRGVGQGSTSGTEFANGGKKKKKQQKCMQTEVLFTLQKKPGPYPLKSGLDHFFNRLHW